MEEKKLLVAVDGSSHSHQIVSRAIEYSKMLNASVILLYCHRKFPSLLGEPMSSEGIAEIIAEAETVISPYIKLLNNSGVVFEERLMEEPAGATISEIARIQKCELIIMGSRGLSNLEGLFVGSVTNKVLHTAHCSVLVVR